MVRSLKTFVELNGWYLAVLNAAHKVRVGIHSAFLNRQFSTEGLEIEPDYLIRGCAKICIGSNFNARKGLWLEAIVAYGSQTFDPVIRIGNNARLSQYVHIGATNRVEIGENVLMGSHVVILDHGHGDYRDNPCHPLTPPAERELTHTGSVLIEDNVWLGEGVAVLPGARIGRGSVIGAHSIVLNEIPAFTLAVGAPAKPIKKFDTELNAWVALTEAPTAASLPGRK